MGVLQQHEALTAEDPPRLTALGGALSSLPVGLHVGKMLLLGSLFHLADPVVTMAAGLSVQVIETLTRDDAMMTSCSSRPSPSMTPSLMPSQAPSASPSNGSQHDALTRSECLGLVLVQASLRHNPILSTTLHPAHQTDWTRGSGTNQDGALSVSAVGCVSRDSACAHVGVRAATPTFLSSQLWKIQPSTRVLSERAPVSPN